MGFIGAGDRTRTGTLSPAVDFESTTSTNSITPAGVTGIVYTILSEISSTKLKKILNYLIVPELLRTDCCLRERGTNELQKWGIGQHTLL